MAQVAVTVKKGLTPAMVALCNVLRAANGKKTHEQLAKDYGEAMGKKVKKSSITTGISVLKTTLAAEGKKFPAAWNPPRASGGGRSVQRISAGDALNSLHFEFEDIADDDSGDDAGEGDEAGE